MATTGARDGDGERQAYVGAVGGRRWPVAPAGAGGREGGNGGERRRLAPARGLLVGLALSALLWAALGLLARAVLTALRPD